MKVQGIQSSSFLLTNKLSLEQIGLSGILIFNDSGIPIYLRNYSKNSPEQESSPDDIIFTAFVSSLANFIKTYDQSEGFLKGFSTLTNHFYIKSVDEILYCLVLNSSIIKLGNGTDLLSILDNSLDQLVKSFGVYYKMTRTKDFIEKNFLDTFENQIDALMFFNLKTSKKFLSNNQSKLQDLQDSNEFHSETFNYSFLKNGILGIFILNHNNEPILMKDYVINQKYIKQADYYQRIVLTLKNTYFLGTIQDIGIGNTRVIIRITRNYTICLIVAELHFWKYDSTIYSLFIDNLLKNIPLSMTSRPIYSYDLKDNTITSDIGPTISYQIDQWLIENLKDANKILTKNKI